jgi:tetratricopeptide (TPR) repeat protein
MAVYSKHISFFIIFGLFLIHSVIIDAQSRSFAGLPIISPSKQINYQSNLNHLPEYDKIQDIYEKLVEAKGDRRMPVPTLNLRSEEAYVASMDYKQRDISIERKAYDIAVKYGDAAIAFLLAHELVHYYEKHGWRSQYADAVSDLETGKVLKSLDDRVVNEVQADVLGGFLAYSAGFGIFENGGSLINDLYKSYKMNDKMLGYPSKQDRIKLADRNQREIAQLANLFEMAGLLTIIGKYSEAYAYYGFLLNKYQSRELYNNAGLTCMMTASSYMDPKVMKFDLPGILDLNFSGDSRSASQREQINILISEALIHFETAIIMNKNYIPSHINKISAYIISALNHTDMQLKKIAFNKANYILENDIKEIQILNPEYNYENVKDELLVLKSILSYFGDDKVAAKKMMSDAVSMGSTIAIKNLAIMEGTVISPKTIVHDNKISIDNMNAESFLSSDLVSRNQTKIDEINIFRVTDQKDKNYKVFTHEFRGNDQTIGYDLGFVISKKSFASPFLNDITIGSDKSSVESIFGKPKRAISHLNGEILLFSDSFIIITDQLGKIDKVIDYKEILKP